MTPPLDHILEGVMLAAGEPLTLERLEAVFDDNDRPGRRALREALSTLEARLTQSALVLEETASGFRLRVRDGLSPWVSRLWDERPQRYSRALLETLALIAYRQPVTRADIEDVRGVSVSASIMRTLVERGWVRVVGHRDVPGRPAVYATTRSFLDDFGLRTLDALPPISAVKEGETVDWLEQLTPNASTPEPTVKAGEEVPDGERSHLSAEGDTPADSQVSGEYPASDEQVTSGERAGHSTMNHDAADNGSSNTEDVLTDSTKGEQRPSERSSIETPMPSRQSPSLDEIGQRLAERLRDQADRDGPDAGSDEKSTQTSYPED
ncbi:SMC-Scp complex subunit ScpB [Kushneria marisflavi]|uniref:SMC-Scp complex subunit ScpB n=1 Tax=Kushneria marisflavi TaxID=157779 RepID=A0A240UL76_9GAMM|nr:SMC-Scp complex subunit ScpB [Kushneria marisflavi]ART62228.1 SMC-Scp complex subunit ScpB [Kushneria marisflavi]RKD87315.1 condensin subunit ScpB [Kushneria marisflavi]